MSDELKKPKRGREVFAPIEVPEERRSELRDLKHLIGPEQEAARRRGRAPPASEEKEPVS